MRKFKGKNGWAPNTDYILVNDTGSFVIRKDGTQYEVAAYSLEYCLAQVECGNWEELI